MKTTKSLNSLFVTLSILLFISACGGKKESTSKTIKFMLFTQYVESYPKLNDELIELALPFYDEETQGEFMPSIMTQRVDTESGQQEFKADFDNAGLSLKIEKLMDRYRDAYKDFELPKSFKEKTNSQGRTKQFYIDLLKNGNDSTTLLLLGKNKNWNFLKDSSNQNMTIIEIIDVKMFRKKIAEVFTKNSNTNFVVVYNVNFFVEEFLDPIQAALDKTEKLTSEIDAKEKIKKAAEDDKRKIEEAIKKTEKSKKEAEPVDAAKLDENIKTLRGLLKQKNTEITTLKSEIEGLKTDLKSLRGELDTEKKAHKETKEKLVEKEKIIENMSADNSNLQEKVKQAKIDSIKKEILLLLEKGGESTKLVKLKGDEVSLYKIDKKGKEVEVTGLPVIGISTKTFNEQRIIYKKALKNYANAYKLSKSNNNLLLNEVLELAEQKRKAYYLLLRKSKETDQEYNNTEDFLKALQ